MSDSAAPAPTTSDGATGDKEAFETTTSTTTPPGPPAKRRTRRRLIIAACLVIGGLWCLIAAFQLVQAGLHAQKGLDLLQSAQEDVGPAELIRGKSLPQMKQAKSEFDQAASNGNSLLLKPFMILPFVGRQVRSVDALTGSAAKVVTVGVDTMEATTTKINKPTTAGPDRVALVRQLGAIAAKARGRLEDVNLGPSNALVGPLSTARKKFGTQLGKARKSMSDVDDASKGIGEMAQGPSKYLVLAANNAEMRSGSGMLLSAGVMDMANGQFELGPMTDTGALKLAPGQVPLTGDQAGRWGWLTPTEEWRYLAMSPNFPANAALAAQMWKAKTGQSVDGVIALDPIALKALLEVSGPVVVDGKTITKDNVVQEILLQQYLDYEFNPSDPNSGAIPTEDRHERSSDIARAVVDQLDSKSWDVAALVDDLRTAAQGRHVLAWSSKPSQQRGWKAAGVAGSLKPDSLMVSLDNRAGNKLDQFVPIQALLQHRPVKGGSEVTVKLHIANNTSSSGLNPYVEGPYPFSGFATGEYRGILALTVPGVARDIHLDGGEQIVAAGPDGPTRVIATNMALLRHTAKDFTLRFTLPEGYEHVTVEPSARYPTITWSDGGPPWQDDSARVVRW